LNVMDIEKLIRENRADFDSEIPSEKVWSSISKNLQSKKKKFSWKPYMAAASVMLFITCTWLIANQKLTDVDSQTSTVSEEVQDAQVQFSSLIEIKRNELKQYKKDNPELVRDFEHQLVELQLSYKQLLPQLKDEKKRDVVLQAVIDNLQMQVEILNQQIEIVKQYKKPKNDTEEIVPL
jgi:chromosome segregation ATPase